MVGKRCIGLYRLGRCLVGYARQELVRAQRQLRGRPACLPWCELFARETSAWEELLLRHIVVPLLLPT